MNRPCERMIDKIVALAMGELNAVEAVEVQKHINSCLGCKKYYRQLENDDLMMSEFVKASEDIFERIEANVAAEIAEVQQEKNDNFIITRYSFKQILWYAAAVIVFAAIGVYIAVSITDDSRDSGKDKFVQKIEQVSDNQGQVGDVKIELKQVMAYAAKRNSKGLINILETGTMPSKLLAAKILADWGIKEAIGPLNRLAEKYPNQADIFYDAIRKIKDADNQQTQQDVNNLSDANVSDMIDKPSNSISGRDKLKQQSSVVVNGYIVDEDNEPVDDAVVRLAGIDGSKIHQAVADANGYYEFKTDQGITDGWYRIGVNSAGYIIENGDGKSNLAEIKTDKILTKDYQLKKGCMLEVEVVDDNDVPVKGAAVTVYSKQLKKIRQRGLFNRDKRTDVNGIVLTGAFKVSDQPYNIVTIHDDYAVDVCQVKLNDVNVIDYVKIVLEKGQDVQGYVHYRDGVAVKNGKIYANYMGIDEEKLYGEAVIDANGGFTLRHMIDGLYRIRILEKIKTKFETRAVVDVNVITDEMLEITIDADSSYGKAKITGKVILEDSNRVDWSTVEVRAVSDEGKVYKRSSVNNGEFVLSGLKDDVYTLVITGENIQTKTVEDVKAPLENLVIELDDIVKYDIKGRVVNAENNQAIQKFKLAKKLIKNTGDSVVVDRKRWYGFVDNSGNFNLKGNSAGVYNILVRAEGFKDGSFEYDTENQDQNIVIYLKPLSNNQGSN